MNNRGRDWSVVDGDPAPGNPDGIRRTGNTFVEIAEVAKSAGHDLRSIKDRQLVDVWQGEAADRFRKSLEEDFITRLGKLERSYFKAGHALQDYATVLTDLQREADPTCDRAHDADRNEHDASHRVEERRRDCENRNSEVERLRSQFGLLNREYYNSGLDHRSPDDPTYDQRYRSWKARYDEVKGALGRAEAASDQAASQAGRAQAEVDDARRRLKAARDQCADIRRRNQDAQRRAADQLEEASRLGIRNKSLFDKFVDANVKLFTTIKDYVTNLDNWDDILQWASLAFTVVGLALSWLPPVGEILLAIGVVLTIARAVVVTVQACQGRDGKDGSDVLWAWGEAVVDVVTFGLGSGATKAGEYGVKGAAKFGGKTVAKELPELLGLAPGFAKKLPKVFEAMEEGGPPLVRGLKQAWTSRSLTEVFKFCKPLSKVEMAEKLAGKVVGLGTEYAKGPVQDYLSDRFFDGKYGDNEFEHWASIARKATEGAERLAPALSPVPPVVYPLLPLFGPVGVVGAALSGGDGNGR